MIALRPSKRTADDSANLNLHRLARRIPRPGTCPPILNPLGMFENVRPVHQGKLLTELRPLQMIADEDVDDNLSRLVRRIPLPGICPPPGLPSPLASHLAYPLCLAHLSRREGESGQERYGGSHHADMLLLRLLA